MPELDDMLLRAKAWLDEHAEEMARELIGFVKIRSVSRADLACPGAPFGQEMKRMLDYALLRAAALGFETKNGDGFYGVASMGDSDSAIGIAAHLDVVPEGGNWLYPPFSGVRMDDFIIGRGASDNKGAAVMALFVMRALKELDIKLNHGVKLIMGLSEETDMRDMAAYNLREKPCAATLIPDGAFPVNYAQKGALNARVQMPLGDSIVRFHGGEVTNMVPPMCEAVLACAPETARAALESAGIDTGACEVSDIGGRARVTAHGKAAHAAHPESGVSAIRVLSEALIVSGLVSGASLSAMQKAARLCADIHGEGMGIAREDADSGKTTMVVGLARSEAGALTLTVDARLSVAADPEADKDAFLRASRALNVCVLSCETTRPVFLSKHDPRVRTLMHAYEAVTGDKAEPYTMGGGTYARVLENAITFGPGYPGFPDAFVRPEGFQEGHGGAHAPDEFVHLPSLRKTALVYIAAILMLDSVV